MRWLFTGGSVIMDNWLVEHLFKGTSVVVLRAERATPARDSNSQPFVYESNSLTIKPRLPHTSIFKQKPTQISCVKQSKNQHYLPIQKNKQRNRGVWIQAFTLLEISPPLESPRYFCGPTSCLIITLLFNVLFLLFFHFFICHLSLSIVDLLISVLSTQIECSLLSIITRHAPYCRLATSGLWDSVPCCSQKHFSNIAQCTFVFLNIGYLQ